MQSRIDSGAASRPSAGTIGMRLCAVLALIALDLASKHYAFAWMDTMPAGAGYDRHGHYRYPVIGQWLGCMLSYNQGMAWGIHVPPYLLIGARAVAVFFLVYLVVRSPLGARWNAAAFVLILAGAAGNLYDNLFEESRSKGHPFGAVRDFIDVYFYRWDYHFPTFNVADSCITVGAVCLLLASLPGSARGGADQRAPD